MITSGFVGLAAFLSVLQLVWALWAIAVSGRTWLFRPGDALSDAGRLEERSYLAALLAYLLLGLSLASWLVLYLMLDSFVPQWPGAMCIYGVTQIGAGSRGIYGWLPSLVLLEQALKPTLVFATGAALVLYRFYRRQGTRTLLPRVAALLLIAATVGAIDAVTAITYLAIPKRESLPNSGCCSVSAVGSESERFIDKTAEQRLYAGYYGDQALMVVILCWYARRMRRVGWAERSESHDDDQNDQKTWWDSLRSAHATFPTHRNGPLAGRRRLLPLVGMAAFTLWISMRFFVDVASPKLLHLPYHHCLYDLVPAVPESGLAMLFLFWATFCVGWAAVVQWAAHRQAPLAAIEVESRRWLAYAVLGYLGSVTMISLDLWLA